MEVSPRTARLRLGATAAVLGLAFAALRGAAPGAEIGALAAALGAASKGHVEARDVRWSASEGAAADALFGRSAVFLSSAGPGAPRDVWRARVRVSPEGHPIEITSASNLTGTPLGDDHALVIRGTRAAFATRAYGQEQSVSLLDLAGEGAQNAATTSADRAMAFVTNLQQTGSGAGVARVDVGFERPAERVGLAVGERALAIDLGDAVGERKLSLDLDKGELTGAGARAEPSRHLPKRFVFWAVDTVRAVSWIGPKPIAWLEDKTFAARDWFKRTFRKKGDADEETLADAPAPVPPRVLDPTSAAGDDGTWPPQNLPSIWKTPERGEGVWVTPKLPWMRKMPGATAETPAFFQETFVRPDDQRPDSKVLLVAMDMRQLELGMEAGTEDPKPLTGGKGPGRLPRDPQVLTRVVAAFNGAFKTEHGNYGMMVQKRVLLPPVPLAATVVTLADDRAAFGSWGNHSEIGGLVAIPDADIVSYRQNLDPLVDDGNVNPTHRGLWGYTLPDTGTQTERSGICVTQTGHMMYAWGDDVSATALGKAMKTAGCVYGMHLDMNPHHTGFVYTTIRDLKSHDYKSSLLTTQMEISTDRYIEYAAKDFFFMTVRDPTPKLGGLAWEPHAGVQPAPRWIPTVWAAKDGAVELVLVDGGRARFRLRAGTGEPDPKTGVAPLYDLDASDAGRVLLSSTMGLALEKRPRALVTGGKAIFPVHDATAGVLSIAADGRLAIARGELPTAADADAAELPLLAFDGAVHPNARLAGPTRTRAALGVTPRGDVVLARATTGSDGPLADALSKVGCTAAVSLDRGTRGTASLLRAGTASPPVAHAEETTLYVLGAPMEKRAFRFQAAPRP